MKSLDEHNAERRQAYQLGRESKPNGIACPECDKELLDTNPDIQLMSCPPKSAIHCNACDFTGYRVV